MGREELRRVRLAGFTELSKVGMDGIRMVWRIGCWTRNVSIRGCKQRRQHQQPGRNDQNGVSGKRRDLWKGQRYIIY